MYVCRQGKRVTRSLCVSLRSDDFEFAHFCAIMASDGLVERVSLAEPAARCAVLLVQTMVPFHRRISGVWSEGRASCAMAGCHEHSRINSSDTELWDPTGSSSDVQTVTLQRDLSAFQRL
ncbi:hypothetical protein QQF64_010567 [Cirrhinus molitorella]|uniref:Uncharacterized protein n=1 Tax=Cirrhinus molitorella TaxID=172907 RepID=A0ABR3LWR8_9TELE